MHNLHRWLVTLALGAVTACNCGPTAATPLVGKWSFRYSCGNATQCFDFDTCSSEELVADSTNPARFTNKEGTLSGTLTGTEFRWKARWGNPAYDEVGVWTFSDDFSSFTQATCYTYDGVADEATLTCSGMNRGECSGAGAKGAAGPPAAVGACSAATGAKTCP
jgi:hypothetical protein